MAKYCGGGLLGCGDDEVRVSCVWEERGGRTNSMASEVCTDKSMCKISIAGSPELTHTKKEWAIMVIALFTSDFLTIQLCIHHILEHKPTPKSSPVH